MGSGVSTADFENELKEYYNAMMPVADSFKYYPGYVETMPLESIFLKAKMQNFTRAVEEDSKEMKYIFGLPSAGRGVAEIGQQVSSSEEDRYLKFWHESQNLVMFSKTGFF
ncbi:hypothetical protein FRC09_007283 [Ceratobasidium sp. 395]|nr:hypothetical protein FRC09_007283 [Ceratobasidium sp. 395]